MILWWLKIKSNLTSMNNNMQANNELYSTYENAINVQDCRSTTIPCVTKLQPQKYIKQQTITL
jgi:hypothetical protein